MALKYDPEAGYLATAFQITNTVVPLVLKHWEFWAFFVLHLLVFLLFRNGYLEGASENDSPLYLGWNEMKVIAAATTFFEVFYTNECFSRYNVLYGLSRRMLGNLYDFAFEVRLILRNTSQSHVRLACRWFTSSVILFFYETNSDVSEKEWGELLRQGLLKSEEQAFLNHFHKQQRSLILLQWTAEVVQDGCGLAKAAPNVQKSLIDKLLTSRILEQKVVDMTDLPMPFQYFHLLNMMVVVNLLLWAYGMGCTRSMFAPVTFFFAALIFMGMLELASALSDPFGDDEVDFPVIDWLNEFLENTFVLVEFDWPIDMESRVEAEKPMRLGKRHLNVFVDENMHSPSSTRRLHQPLLSRSDRSKDDMDGPEDGEDDEED